MVGQITYTEDQILFILRLTLSKEKRDVILRRYQERFNKPLTASQLRYVKSKYGHDPEFGTALINGTLPESGGNRKTAPPSPERSTSIPAQYLLSINDDHPAMAVCLTPTHNHLQQLGDFNTDILPPNNYNCFPNHPETLQQETKVISPAQPHESTRLLESRSTAVLVSSGILINAHEPTRSVAAWDSDNPYGFQPVLEHYRTKFNRSTKRKRDDSVGADAQPNFDARLHDVGTVGKDNTEPLEAESRGILTKFEVLPKDFNLAKDAVVNSPGTPKTIPKKGEAGQPLTPLGEFLKGTNVNDLARDNTMPALMSFQLPQIGYYNPQPHIHSDYGTEGGVDFMIPTANSMIQQPALANTSFNFSEMNTDPSWDTSFSNNSAWNTVPEFTSFMPPPTAGVVLSADLAMASCIDPALSTAADRNSDMNAAPYIQQWSAEDCQATAPREQTVVGPTDFANTYDFDWEKVSPLDENDEYNNLSQF